MARPPARPRAQVLIGDVGGTHARLRVHELGRDKPLAAIDGDSRAAASLDDIVVPFLKKANASPVLAVLGVAGPVRDGAATITNLPWKLDERALAKKTGIGRVVLWNDLAVAARGCLELDDDELLPLTPARPAAKGKHLGVIAAGTGLGEARLIWDGKRHLALATEGSHCDFAPRSPLELELWHFLHARHPDHVSYERVVSGAGLGALYDFFSARAGRESAAIRKRLADGDKNAAIAELGLARASRPAARAVDLFASIYGSEAGNLALRELSLGGIYVVGNIARQIVPERREAFLDGFGHKGRFAALMAEIPIAVVTAEDVALRGALAVARELVEQQS
jgi:glucokinase